MDETARPDRTWWLWVGAIVLAGAVLRFATIDAQSIWLDESLSLGEALGSLGHVFSSVAQQELNPPLYFLTLHLWTGVLGSSPEAMRALSVLYGLATIVVAALIGRKLAGPRAGLAAAAIAALNPMLFHYSQELRAYPLMILLAACSLLGFLYAREQATPRRVACWAVPSALALLTHYFTALIVLPEAVALLRRRPWPRPLLLGAGGVALAALAVAPLALHQRGREFADQLSDDSLPQRIAIVVKQFLVGPNSPSPKPTAALAGVLVGVAAVCVLAAPRARAAKELRIALIVGATVIALPVLGALGGLDYFDARNVLPALIPLVAVAASAVAIGRWPRVAAGAFVLLAGLWVWVILTIASDKRYQRDDWRGMAKALATAGGSRLVLSTPGEGVTPLQVYRPQARELKAGAPVVGEIDVLALGDRRPGEAGSAPAIPSRPPPAPGFRLAGSQRSATWTLLRYRAPAPMAVDVARLRSPFGADSATVREPAGARYATPG